METDYQLLKDSGYKGAGVDSYRGTLDFSETSSGRLEIESTPPSAYIEFDVNFSTGIEIDTGIGFIDDLGDMMVSLITESVNSIVQFILEPIGIIADITVGFISEGFMFIEQQISNMFSILDSSMRSGFGMLSDLTKLLDPNILASMMLEGMSKLEVSYY